MATASARLVQQVVEAVSRTDAPVTGDFLARHLRVHKTSAQAAANEAVRLGLLNRTKVDSSARGQRPYVYTVALEGDVLDTSVFEKKTRNRKPKKLKRGTADAAVASVVATYKAGPGGRGFTVRELESKVKGTTYETIRKAIVRLHNQGLIEDTGRHRKGSVVYRPVLASDSRQPAEPVVTKPSPAPSALPTQPTSVETLAAERAQLRGEVKAAEKRIAEIDREFDRIRKLLG